MASNSNTKNSGKGGVTTAVSAWYDSETGDSVRLCINTTVKGSSNGPWGYGVVGQSGYQGNGSNWREVGRGVFNYANTVVNGTAYFTVSKTHGGWTANCWAKSWGEAVSGYGAYIASDDVRCNVWIPARSSYTVSYNANGGSGAPSAQTKWHGETLNLSSTKPTRDGYEFAGWGTSATDTGVKYAAGGQYTGNASITLYAIWTNVAKLTINYNANGGSGAPVSQTHLINTTSKISGAKPTRNNYVFLGWSTSSSATKATYIADGQYTNNSFTDGATVTLYAVWLKKSPSIYINSSEHSFKSVWVNVPSGKSLKSIWFKTG